MFDVTNARETIVEVLLFDDSTLLFLAIPHTPNDKRSLHGKKEKKKEKEQQGEK